MTDQTHPGHDYWRLWPNEEDGPWIVGVRLERIDGKFAPVGIQVWGYVPDTAKRDNRFGRRDFPGRRAVTAQAARVPVQQLADEARAALHALLETELMPSALPGPRVLDSSPELRQVILDLQRASTLRPSRGTRTGADPEELAEVASVYLAAQAAGLRPTKAVQQAFYLSPSAAAKRVMKARQAGLIPPAAGPGQPGPVPTKEKS